MRGPEGLCGTACPESKERAVLSRHAGSFAETSRGIKHIIPAPGVKLWPRFLVAVLFINCSLVTELTVCCFPVEVRLVPFHWVWQGKVAKTSWVLVSRPFAFSLNSSDTFFLLALLP